MSAPRGRLVRLCQKELRETLRDRRTIITLLLMPLLVYPILSMTLNRFLLAAGQEQDTEIYVGVATEAEGRWLRAIVDDPRSEPPEVIARASDDRVARFTFIAPQEDQTLSDLLRTQLVAITAQVYLEDDPPSVRITALEENGVSLAARRVMIERLRYFNQSLIDRALLEAGVEPPTLIAMEVGQLRGSGGQPLLASIIPLVLVLMTITGAVYPAIDLTAGERERGTMEALIASPVPRGAVLFSKYVAVVTVALLTAVANLVAMFVTLWAGGLLELLVGRGQPIPWLQFLQILALLVLFSGFFSALLLTLTSFARSFKEAQAYLIPLMLVSLTPGILSLMPGVELTGPLAVVPLLNIILLSREILAGTAAAGATVVAILSTIAYAVAALAIAARLFGSDAVLRGSELSIGAAVQRPVSSRPRPTISEAAMTLALLLPLYYVVSNALGQIDEATISQRLVLNAVSLLLVFGGLPLAAALYCRDTLSTTYRTGTHRTGVYRTGVYRTGRPKWLVMFGAALLGLGLWAFAFELFVIAKIVGLSGFENSIAGAESLVAQLRTISPVLMLATLAVAPAVVEEFCFRGYLFSALAERLSPGKTIVITAVIFGLFHVLTGKALLLERFLPTTMLGLVLGAVAWRSGSVWPGMLLHLIHNAFLELVIWYRDELQEFGIGAQEQEHLPVSWLLVCAALVAAGAGLVARYPPSAASKSLPPRES